MLLVGVPGLLRDIVWDALAGHEDIDLVLESSADAAGPAVNANHPGTVVWCGRESPPEATVRALLYDHPRLRILAIAGEGRAGVLHELVPHASSVRDLSPEVLLHAVRGGQIETD